MWYQYIFLQAIYLLAVVKVQRMVSHGSTFQYKEIIASSSSSILVPTIARALRTAVKTRTQILFFFSQTFVNVMTNALFLFEGFVVIVITVLACFRVIQVCSHTPWQFSSWETCRKSQNLFNWLCVRNYFRILQQILSILDSVFVL